MGERANVRYIAGDALGAADAPLGLNPEVVAHLERAREAGLALKLVANLPYSIATPLIVRLLEADLAGRLPFALLAATVQAEVAGRLTARAITKEYGAPSALVQALARAEVVRRVSRRAFFPPPRVESAMVLVVPRRPDDRFIDPVSYPRFRDLVRAVFQYRRKTVRNALARGLGLEPAVADRALRAAGVDPEARVESLAPAALAAVAAALPGASS